MANKYSYAKKRWIVKQRLIQRWVNGELTLEELKAYGIKFAKVDLGLDKEN